MNRAGWEDQKVLVVGLGVSGYAAARVLLSLDARVKVTEQQSTPETEQRASWLRDKGAEVELGSHELAAGEHDVAVISPGIAPTSDVLKSLSAKGVRQISEVELAFSIASCDFLAVTGTNGKTTTTSLLARMLQEAGVPSLAAGNIGHPLADAAGTVPSGGAIAVEVSSFQLAAIDTFRPRVAVVLNVAEDHTDWHGTFRSYVDAKARITENQQPEDVLVFNAEDPDAREIAGRSRARTVPFSHRVRPPDGAGPEDGYVCHRDKKVIPLGDVVLPGTAGLEDTIAACAAALEYGLDEKAVASAIASFSPLPHRLQVIAEVDGVLYVDDSKATNPHATIAAVKGFEDVVLIAGGRSKGIDLSVLATSVPPVRGVVALGEARDEVASVFKDLVPVETAGSMAEAVRLARDLSNGKGSVLLSPGCASLDMFASYAARGDAFVEEVRRLIEEGGARGKPD
ncbi:MAG: UDP-N-acetylmuramoyl-L-alanine--D-glutamate ligase [Actinomycetota bacterium]|nr:UDP-N-acetylmuramoyl-L-alanine--D-glutamate ligase [Actinomycetota bacterium]